MNILYYFRNEGTYMYTWQINHIVSELQMHECFIDIINPLDFQTTEEANEELITRAKSGKYSLFMTCLNDMYLYNDTIKEIRRIGLPALLFCPDNLLSPFINERDAFLFDLVWLTSRETEYLYKKWKCNTIFLPYAANPNLFKPAFDSEILNAGFIGNPHGSRSDRINYLARKGIPVSVHCKKTIQLRTDESKKTIKPVMTLSQNIVNYLRYPIGRRLLLGSIIDKTKKHGLDMVSKNILLKAQVPFDEMGKIMSSYSLMLSFTEAKSTGILAKPVPIINLRQFEIPMAGGLQFTMYNDELAGYFEDGKEIIMCKTLEEYADKAKYYLIPEKRNERLKIKINARKRAENEHTWWNRFSKIFEEMNLNVKRN